MNKLTSDSDLFLLAQMQADNADSNIEVFDEDNQLSTLTILLNLNADIEWSVSFE